MGKRLNPMRRRPITLEDPARAPHACPSVFKKTKREDTTKQGELKL